MANVKFFGKWAFFRLAQERISNRTKFESHHLVSQQAIQVLVISAIISALILVSQIVIARNMNSKDFATYASVGALINVTGILFSSLLLNQVKLLKANVGSLSGKFFDRGATQTLILAFILSISVMLLVVLQNTGTPATIILLAGFFILVISMLATLNSKLQGLGKLRTLALSTFITVSMSLLAHIFLIQWELLSVSTALLATLLANVLTFIVFSVTLKPAGLENSSIFSTPSIKLALVSTGYWFFVNADILFSPVWLDDIERGAYSAASAVAKISIIACTIINGLFLNNLLNQKRSRRQPSFSLVGRFLFVEACVVLVLMSCIYFFGDRAFEAVYGTHLTSDPGFLFQISAVGIPLVLAGMIIQILVAYSNSWASGAVVWFSSLAFLSLGSTAHTKEDVVNFYLAGSWVFASLLLATLIYLIRKNK